MSESQIERAGFFNNFWPAVLVPVGLGLTIVWIGALGYGVLTLVQLVI